MTREGTWEQSSHARAFELQSRVTPSLDQSAIRTCLEMWLTTVFAGKHARPALVGSFSVRYCANKWKNGSARYWVRRSRPTCSRASSLSTLVWGPVVKRAPVVGLPIDHQPGTGLAIHLLFPSPFTHLGPGTTLNSASPSCMCFPVRFNRCS